MKKRLSNFMTRGSDYLRKSTANGKESPRHDSLRENQVENFTNSSQLSENSNSNISANLNIINTELNIPAISQNLEKNLADKPRISQRSIKKRYPKFHQISKPMSKSGHLDDNDEPFISPHDPYSVPVSPILQRGDSAYSAMSVEKGDRPRENRLYTQEKFDLSYQDMHPSLPMSRADSAKSNRSFSSYDREKRSRSRRGILRTKINASSVNEPVADSTATHREDFRIPVTIVSTLSRANSTSSQVEGRQSKIFYGDKAKRSTAVLRKKSSFNKANSYYREQDEVDPLPFTLNDIRSAIFGNKNNKTEDLSRSRSQRVPHSSNSADIDLTSLPASLCDLNVEYTHINEPVSPCYRGAQAPPSSVADTPHSWAQNEGAAESASQSWKIGSRKRNVRSSMLKHINSTLNNNHAPNDDSPKNAYCASDQQRLLSSSKRALRSYFTSNNNYSGRSTYSGEGNKAQDVSDISMNNYGEKSTNSKGKLPKMQSPLDLLAIRKFGGNNGPRNNSSSTQNNNHKNSNKSNRSNSNYNNNNIKSNKAVIDSTLNIGCNSASDVVYDNVHNSYNNNNMTFPSGEHVSSEFGAVISNQYIQRRLYLTAETTSPVSNAPNLHFQSLHTSSNIAGVDNSMYDVNSWHENNERKNEDPNVRNYNEERSKSGRVRNRIISIQNLVLPRDKNHLNIFSPRADSVGGSSASSKYVPSIEYDIRLKARLETEPSTLLSPVDRNRDQRQSNTTCTNRSEDKFTPIMSDRKKYTSFEGKLQRAPRDLGTPSRTPPLRTPRTPRSPHSQRSIFGDKDDDPFAFDIDSERDTSMRSFSTTSPGPSSRGLQRVMRPPALGGGLAYGCDSDQFLEDGCFQTGGYAITAAGIIQEPKNLRRRNSNGVALEDDAKLNKRVIESLNDIIIIRNLGQGASSQVRLAYHKLSDTYLAVKLVNVYDDKKKSQLIKELETLQGFTSRFLVAFHGAFYDGSGTVHILLEYMNPGSLAEVIQQYGAIPEEVTCVIAKHCLLGLNFLHNSSMLHRDLKTENILLCEECSRAKLSDFGLAREIQQNTSTVETFVGTLAYMSPERLNGVAYTYAGDIWSFGISIMECLLGRFPFEKPQSFFDYIDKIGKVEKIFPKGKFSRACEEFIYACTDVDPKKRPTTKELLEHPWILSCTKDPQALGTWLERVRLTSAKKTA